MYRNYSLIISHYLFIKLLVTKKKCYLSLYIFDVVLEIKIDNKKNIIILLTGTGFSELKTRNTTLSI